MSNDPNTKKEINGSCCAMQLLFQKAIEIYKSDQVVSSAEQLEKPEQKVCDLTDQLQAIIIEERLRVHFTTKEIPAASLGLIESGLVPKELFSIQGIGYQRKAGHFSPFWLYGNDTIKQILRSCQLIEFTACPVLSW